VWVEESCRERDFRFAGLEDRELRDVVRSAVLSPGTAKAFSLDEGDVVKISSPDGGQGGDLTFLGFDQALTRNINGWEKFGSVKLTFYADPGMKLYDGEGIPHLEVAEIHSALRVDIMYPGCWRELYADGRAGCRDLLSSALGVERRELTGMASFFAKCAVDEQGYMFSSLAARPGDYLVLRAVRPLTLAVSACPDDTLPGIRPSDLLVEVERG
jgi:aminomethyltransferase